MHDHNISNCSRHADVSVDILYSVFQGDDDDGIPLARLVRINFTEHNSIHIDNSLTESLTDEYIINNIILTMKETEDSHEDDTITIENPFKSYPP